MVVRLEVPIMPKTVMSYFEAVGSGFTWRTTSATELKTFTHLAGENVIYSFMSD